MLKIDRINRNFSSLVTPTLADVEITERYDLQEYISNSPNLAFKEITGQELFLLGAEVEPSENVQDRIDLLAVDKEGVIVVVELKRGSHKLHLLQAISYAAMISQWGVDDFLQLLDDDNSEALTDFLEVEKENINRKQRIVLIAEAYDYALLVSAEWLSENYGVDITCSRIAVATDATTDSEYLVCSNVFPAPELSKEAVQRGYKRRDTISARWLDWNSALEGITNAAVKMFFEQELSREQESYLRKRGLWYRIAGKRRWNVSARTKNAYVWQRGRFEGDIEYWKAGLGRPDDIKPVKAETCLRMFLVTRDDFLFFRKSATEKLLSVKWTDSVNTDH